jgi:LuxR family maltose regulon positive regulatory protein
MEREAALLEAIVWIDPWWFGVAGRRCIHRPGQLAAALTERELTVLRLLPTRLTTREIGRELDVSPNTVRSQVQAIYRKLQVNRRAEAVTNARQLGLLPTT